MRRPAPPPYTVTLSNPSATPVTVAYGSANGTATAGSDYTATSGSLTLHPVRRSPPSPCPSPMTRSMRAARTSPSASPPRPGRPSPPASVRSAPASLMMARQVRTMIVRPWERSPARPSPRAATWTSPSP
ncbi:MAG: hypothetical protein IPL70_12265 [Uliginosibacterium sp.]|nr:hypothetical protein [Uliginosibacterium sp.]